MALIKLHSLPFKINTAIVTTALVISLLFIAFLYSLEINRREDQVKRINLLLDTVFKQKINDLANELFSRQERALKATLNEMQAVDGIVGVCAYDETGRLFLTSNNQLHGLVKAEQIKNLEQKPIFKRVQRDGRSLGVYASIIEVIGKKIGYIAIYYDLSRLESESRKVVTLIAALLIATTLLMAILLNLFLFRSIIQPVSVLRNAMRRVEAGHLGETVILPGKDEIGDMGSAFNDMSHKLCQGREALIAAEEKYRSIFENAIEGIFQSSPQRGRFITVNPSMAAILGYASPGEVIEAIQDAGCQFFASEAGRLEYEQTLERSGRIIGLETELRTKDGNLIWASISARRVTGEDGRAIYDEGSFVDITERRQRGEAEREREAAESANRAKSEFLAKMSHEIRTPLNAILGFADILDGALTDDILRSHVAIIKSSGTNLLQLINDILDLSKIEAGRMEIKPTAVDLRSLITELLSLFSMSASRKGIDLRTVISPDLPDVLMLDRARMRQVLFNLIGNAVKFTQQGYVEIKADVRSTTEQDLWDVRIEVRDTGAGIEAGAFELIFESFRQAHRGQPASTEGTGLGLAISKNLIEMMGGWIQVDSIPGGGSVFSVLLPGTAAAVSAPSASAAATDRCVEQTGTVFKPALLLVVDDLAVNRQLVKESLKESPLRILETDNGHTAVKMAAAHQPDLILMDIKMPGLNGYETLRLIRQQSSGDAPAVAITAAGMKEDIRELKSSGFDDYLIRPFNKCQLYQKLARFLAHEIHPSEANTGTGLSNIDCAEDKHDATWQCSGRLAALLRGQYRKTWEKIRKRQNISEIKNFSEEIRILGERHGVEVLVRYGKNLAKYADAIDIDKLQSSLAEFPTMLNGMKVPEVEKNEVEERK
jgi:PAS domain S-box-containing protein